MAIAANANTASKAVSGNHAGSVNEPKAIATATALTTAPTAKVSRIAPMVIASAIYLPAYRTSAAVSTGLQEVTDMYRYGRRIKLARPLYQKQLWYSGLAIQV